MAIRKKVFGVSILRTFASTQAQSKIRMLENYLINVFFLRIWVAFAQSSSSLNILKFVNFNARRKLDVACLASRETLPKESAPGRFLDWAAKNTAGPN